MTQQEPDSERIAQVTYLFGIKPDTAPAASPVVERAETPTKVSIGSTTEAKSARPENVSMHALTRRGMSIAEMTRLLEAREIDPDDVEAEIERLEGVGLLDDHALADNLVRTLQDRKGLGRSAISAELRRRKVGQGAIDEALEAIDTDDELTRAIEVATKRAGQLSSYDAATAKRRLGAYLQRRGYSGSVLSAAMNAALSMSHASPRDTGGVQFR
jgi:regulatory protein